MHGVYLLWWVRERHVSPAAVAAILAAGDLALTALEVPTGWLADRYGHRLSLIAGSAIQAAGMLCCWLGRGIPGLLTASLLVALGDSFRSGADQALLYRSCVALDREADFQRLEARSRAVTLVALVMSVLAGGALVAAWGFAVGWLVETTLSVVGLAIACAMFEPPASVGLSTANGVAISTEPARTSRALLAGLIVPASVLGGLAGAASFFAQTSSWATPSRTTLLTAGTTLMEAAGAMLARRLTADMPIQLMLGAVGASFIGVALVQPSAVLAALVGLSFLLGIAEPLRATAIQRLSADAVRARTASIASACDKAVATIALVGAGILPRRR